MAETGETLGPRRENVRDEERIEILGELNGEIVVFQPMAIS